MSLRRAFGALVAAIAMVACAPTEAPAEEGPMQITLQRTECYGHCPAYTVTIDGDGAVTYEGRAFVNVTGRQTAQVPSADVARLLERFDAVGFDQLNDEYRGQMTDLPTTTITLIRDGRTKRLVDYGGTSAGMPREIRDLQAEIDRVAGTARWVLRDGQPVRTPPEH
ncbi:DUF6438 domain-containing protein [Terricaulis sp.]|uniref:DUF6438 domain-containing protein n=1 Tax=Terricaulis sp. TaxID=2768686 RepID=UPI002AC4F761|nr:DUF6438 domain-containing protein [Terricaulis sp.]MDZ4689956.1 DUF6438 domain-containing protein [Terricaulis sp.]